MFGETMGHQLCPIRSERIGFDDVSAGVDVIEMNLADKLRVRNIQFIEAAADEHAFAVEHRPHRPITHEDMIFQPRQEVLHRRKV